jgi:hypothetical protein
VWEPTRITHTSATCIDLFITNRPNLVLDIKVSPNFCSDLCPISVDINIKTSKEQCYKRTIRKYDQADYNSIIHEMEGKNWSILCKNKTVNENYSNFLSILNETCDKHETLLQLFSLQTDLAILHHLSGGYFCPLIEK